MRALARAVVAIVALIAAMPATAAAATCPDGREGAGWTLSTTRRRLGYIHVSASQKISPCPAHPRSTSRPARAVSRRSSCMA